MKKLLLVILLNTIKKAYNAYDLAEYDLGLDLGGDYEDDGQVEPSKYFEDHSPAESGEEGHGDGDSSAEYDHDGKAKPSNYFEEHSLYDYGCLIMS